VFKTYHKIATKSGFPNDKCI